jgi:uncharacterized protein (DUF1015 family)
MPRIRPFVGLLYDPSVTGPLEAVTTPPYDAIDGPQRDRYLEASPYNVVRLILGRDLPGDGREVNRYTRAGDTLRRWRRDGALVTTASPALFPYEFRFHLAGDERTVRGIIVEVDLEPLGGSIVAHERTLPGPIADRTAVLRAVRANLSPVYAVIRGPSVELARLLDDTASTPPALELQDESGTRHRLWVAADAGPLVADALRADTLMIADGHHRYAVALAHKEQMNAGVGAGPWDRMMMLVVDAATQDPPVLPIHRVLSGPPPDGPDVRLVRDLAEVLASLDDDTLVYGLVRADPGGGLSHAIGMLHGTPPAVSALHEGVLSGLALRSLRFEPDAALAEERVRSGRATAAYLLPPTRVERIYDVIQSGRRLPQKSTYFWPKPRTGLVIRPFDM